MAPESLDQKLALFLRARRGEATFSQFARKVGLTGSTLHRLENGQQSATLRVVQQVMKSLRCSYEDIFEVKATGLAVAEPKAGSKIADQTSSKTVTYRKRSKKK